MLNIKIYGDVFVVKELLSPKHLENNDIDFDTIVTVKYFPESNSYSIINMCGECLQIAINHEDLKVIVDDKGTLREVKIDKALPFAYK